LRTARSEWPIEFLYPTGCEARLYQRAFSGRGHQPRSGHFNATLTSVPAGHLSDRTSPRLVLAGGALAFLLAYGTFAATGPSVSVLLLAFVLAGVGIGCVETAEHAAVAVAAPATIRGSAFGLLAAVQSFGNLAPSGIAGLIWTLPSPEAAFVYIAGWMLLALEGLATSP